MLGLPLPFLLVLFRTE